LSVSIQGKTVVGVDKNLAILIPSVSTSSSEFPRVHTKCEKYCLASSLLDQQLTLLCYILNINAVFIPQNTQNQWVQQAFFVSHSFLKRGTNIW
jgi:hypothetical protein